MKSAIVRLFRRSGDLPDRAERDFFCNLSKKAFMHRRKQLARILSSDEELAGIDLSRARGILESIGIDTKARPENLAVAEWCRLSRALLAEQRGV